MTIVHIRTHTYILVFSAVFWLLRVVLSRVCCSLLSVVCMYVSMIVHTSVNSDCEISRYSKCLEHCLALGRVHFLASRARMQCFVRSTRFSSMFICFEVST
jgi:hypothetical protein